MHAKQKFDRAPFRGLQDDAHYYHNAVFDEALSTLVDGISSNALLLLLTGAPGTGKTTLLERLLRTTLGTTASVVQLPRMSLGWAEFLDTLYSVAEPEGSAVSIAEKTESVRQSLIEQRQSMRTVLLVDDADSVDPEFVQNLAELARSNDTEQNLLQVVFAGNPELEAHLRKAGVCRGHEAEIVCCRLRPLEPEEVGEFIEQELDASGYPGEAVFSPEAVQLIAYHSHGLPRRIHMLCSTALRVAKEKGHDQVTSEDIESLVGGAGTRRAWSLALTPLQNFQRLGPTVGERLASARRWVKGHADRVNETLNEDGYLLPQREPPPVTPRSRRLKTQVAMALGVGGLTLWIWLMVLTREEEPEPWQGEILAENEAPFTVRSWPPDAERDPRTESGRDVELQPDQMALLQAQYAELKALLEKTVEVQEENQQGVERLAKDYLVLAARADKLDQRIFASEVPVLASSGPVSEVPRLSSQTPGIPLLRETGEVEDVGSAATSVAEVIPPQQQDTAPDRVGPGVPATGGSATIGTELAATVEARPVVAEVPGIATETPPELAEAPSVSAATQTVATETPKAPAQAPPEPAEAPSVSAATQTVATEPRAIAATLPEPAEAPLVPAETQPLFALMDETPTVPSDGESSSMHFSAEPAGRIQPVADLPDTLPSQGVGAAAPGEPPLGLPKSRASDPVELERATPDSEGYVAVVDTMSPVPPEGSSSSEASEMVSGDDAEAEPGTLVEVTPEENVTMLEISEQTFAAVSVTEPQVEEHQRLEDPELASASRMPEDAATRIYPDAPRLNTALDADLVRAVETQDVAEVTSLLSRGADPDARMSSGDTVMMSAAARGSHAMVTKLLAGGAHPERKNGFGETALMRAAWHGHVGVVATLLDAGAELEAVNDAGWTALFYAAINGRVDTVRVLLARGARVNTQAGDGRTALAAAVWNSHAEVTDALLANGADVNQKDANGWTPLITAAWNGDTLIIQSLLAYGADDSQQSDSGETALVVAQSQGHVAAVQLLNSP